MPTSLIDIISEPRMAPYMRAAGHDPDKAMRLYAWNMHISASFLPALCCAEIGLRNLVAARLEAVYAPQWWGSLAFHSIAGPTTKGIIRRAENAISGKGRDPDHGRMIAELSFGFWGKMLLPKYQTALWTPVHSCFPDLPAALGLVDLARRCEAVLVLRNRISHHEPIINRNLSQDHTDVLELIGWLSAEKAKWIRPISQVMLVMRQKPK